MAKAKKPSEMFAEKVGISSLNLDSENARKHSAGDIEAIGRSLKKFGQQTPIVVDREGVVLKGNGTVMAAKTLGWKDIWVVRSELNGDEARAYSIADNKTGELSAWDEEELEKHIKSLAEASDDLIRATGFSSDEVEKFLEEKAEELNDLPPGEPLEIRGFGMVWLLVGASPDKGLEVAELAALAIEKLGSEALVETTIGNAKEN